MNRNFLHELYALLGFFLVFGISMYFGGCTMLRDDPKIVETTVLQDDGKTIKEIIVTTSGGRTYWFILNSEATIDIIVDGKVVGQVHIAKNDIITNDSLQAMVEKYFSTDLSVERVRAKNAVDLAKINKSSSSSSSSDTTTDTADGSSMDSAINIENTSIRWKPVSTNDGNLSVLTPSDQDQKTVKVYDKNGNLLDELNNVGRTNGERYTYRSNHSGAELAEESGGRVYMSLEDSEGNIEWYYITEADQNYNG